MTATKRHRQEIVLKKKIKEDAARTGNGAGAEESVAEFNRSDLVQPPRIGGRLVHSSLVYGIGDFLATGISGFLVVPLYLHFMKPAEYGLYSSAAALVGMLGVLSSLGLNSAFGRFYFIYIKTGEERSYLRSIWAFQTVVSIGLAAVFCLFAPVLWVRLCPDVPIYPYLPLVVLGGFISFSAAILSLWFRVREQALAFVVVQVGGVLLFGGLVVALVIWMRLGPLGALMASLAPTLATGVVAALLLSHSPHARQSLDYVWPSLRFGGWMLFGSLSYQLLNKAQLFFLQNYRDLASVGIFNVGQQLAAMLTLVTVSFDKAWQPIIYSSRTKEEAAHALAAMSRYYVSGMLWVTLGIILLSAEILRILAKSDYSTANGIIRIMAAGAFIYSLSLISSGLLLYEKRADLSIMTSIIPAVLVLAVSPFIIPRYGMIGSAIATSLSYVLLTIISGTLAFRLVRIPLDWMAIANILISGCCIVLAESMFLAHFGVSRVMAFVVRVGLLCSFPLILISLRVFTLAEVHKLVVQASRMIGPGTRLHH